VVEQALEASEDVSVDGLDDVWSRDRETRRLAESFIANL